ncbi:hypothetical protein Z948_2063 [Sulfitobacter donghicola DSW-25 = KCTC 12864 = JCM 14565]|nr:hypothetical protein Z948_2063 [Sulfitobacter donghicola DSW-25 = KCTC 12864 = JCM 14565]
MLVQIAPLPILLRQHAPPANATKAAPRDGLCLAKFACQALRPEQLTQ